MNTLIHSGMILIFPSISVTIIIRKCNLLLGNAILLESDYDIIRCCGLIQQWVFYPVTTGTVKFIVWRTTTESGNDYNRKVVGVNSYTVSGKYYKNGVRFLFTSNCL